MSDKSIRAGEIRAFGKMNVPKMTPELMGLVNSGKIYSLEQIIEPGIPYWNGHQPLVITTFFRHGDSKDFYPTSIANEFVSIPMHGSTHIDALSHIGKYVGDDVKLHNEAIPNQNNTGQIQYGAENFPPLVMRGVLLDMAGYKETEVLPPSYGINGEDLAGCEEKQGVKISEGTAVLIRTGFEKYWKTDNGMYSGAGAGLNLDGAQYLVSKGASVVGSDTEAVEQMPPSGPGLPVHQFLICDNGVTHIEALHLDDLASDKLYEFLFICLPLRIKGATGSVVHPIAIG